MDPSKGSRPSRSTKIDGPSERKASPSREPAEKQKTSNIEKLVTRLKENNCNAILLCDTRLTEEDVAALAKTVKVSTSIRTLSLFDTNLSVAGAKALGEALTSQEHLTMLDLGHNNLGPAGVEAFCNALIRNSSLRTLGLANTHMENSGATAMAHVLRMNCTLTEVYLNSNRITLQGAKELAGALVFNDRSRLSKLFLYGNDMTEEGVGEFQKLLQDSPDVEERVPLSPEMTLALLLGTHPRVGKDSAVLALAGEQTWALKGDKKARRQVHPLLRIVRECSTIRQVKRHIFGLEKEKK